jgi:hypothetical protein
VCVVAYGWEGWGDQHLNTPHGSTPALFQELLEESKNQAAEDVTL